MDDGSRARGRADSATIEPPRWSHWFMALAGAARPIGPTLGVLWPR